MTEFRAATDQLTAGELALLADAAVDDVSFVWVLIHLEIRGDRPIVRDWRPSSVDLDLAFASITRLAQRGLVEVGTFELSHPAKPRFVPEPPAVARTRLQRDLALVGDSWEESCWVVGADGADLDAVISRASYERFAELAEEYCDLPHALTAYKPAERPRVLQRTLSALINQAIELPPIEPHSDTSTPDIPHAEWESIFDKYNDALGNRGTYWTTSMVSGSQKAAALLLPLADDLADIWRDLAGGIRAYNSGGQAEDVFWEWRFSFHSHWGAHAVAALRALHALSADQA